MGGLPMRLLVMVDERALRLTRIEGTSALGWAMRGKRRDGGMAWQRFSCYGRGNLAGNDTAAAERVQRAFGSGRNNLGSQTLILRHGVGWKQVGRYKGGWLPVCNSHCPWPHVHCPQIARKLRRADVIPIGKRNGTFLPRPGCETLDGSAGTCKHGWPWIRIVIRTRVMIHQWVRCWSSCLWNSLPASASRPLDAPFSFETILSTRPKRIFV